MENYLGNYIDAITTVKKFKNENPKLAEKAESAKEYLKGFYEQLENILSARLNMTAMEKYLAIIADNSSKGIYLEDGTLVGHLLPDIDGGLGKSQKLQRRLSL